MGISPTEQEVYRHFYQSKVVLVDDATSFLGDYRRAVIALNGLAKKHYAKKIKRGLYALVPFEQAPDRDEKFVPDKILVANKFTDNSYLSHHTALEVWNAAERPMHVAFITTENRVPTLIYKGVKYLCYKTEHFFGFEDKQYKGVTVRVSDREKTILDCLRNIDFTNGIDELKLIIPRMKPLDFEKIFSYLNKIDEVSLFSRAGYTFSAIRHDVDTPDWFIEKCKDKLTQRTYYLDISRKGSSRHVKEWKLMVPL